MSFITKKLEEFDKLNTKLKGKEYTTVGILKNKILLSNALNEMIKEVENVVDKKIAIHSELEEQWTGMTVSGYIESINPHTEKKDALLNIKQSLSSLREGNK